MVLLVCSPAAAVTLARIEAKHAAGLLPVTVQPYDKSLRVATDRWDPFEVVVGVSSSSAEPFAGEVGSMLLLTPKHYPLRYLQQSLLLLLRTTNTKSDQNRPVEI